MHKLLKSLFAITFVSLIGCGMAPLMLKLLPNNGPLSQSSVSFGFIAFGQIFPTMVMPIILYKLR